MNERTIPFGEKLATLIVDGVEQEINQAVYGENAALVLTDAFEASPADYTGRGREPFRAALVVRNNHVIENMSVRPALVGGSVTDQTLKNVTIQSRTANFNHVIVENSTYSIDGCEFIADTDSDGKRVCDFDGYGSVICAYKNAKVSITNSHLFSRGVAKTVVFVDGGADVLLKDCRYECMGGTLYAGYKNAAGFSKMVAPPWVLGITGSARGTNLMGELSTMTIVNCDCKANDWGVVSTDGGEEMALFVVDSTLTLLGEGNMLDNPYVHRFGPGYGLYACGCDEYICGTEFNVGTYAIIGIGGNITLKSSNGTIVPRKKYLVPTGKMAALPPDGHMGEVKEARWHDEPLFPPIEGKGKPTIINSDGWGFMFHAPCNISVLDGTIVNTDYATFLIRSVSSNIVIDHSTLNAKDGTILQLMDNDDKAVGGYFIPDVYDENGNKIQDHIGPIFNHEFFEHPGYPCIDYQTECKASGAVVTMQITNADICGNMYNATGYRNLGDFNQGQGEALQVTLGEGAVLCGAITSASAKHINEKGQDNNIFTQEQYYYLGHVANTPYYNGVNPVRVTLENGAVWNVSGECRLAELRIDNSSIVNAAAISVDGIIVELKSGIHYIGDIVLRG